jgi:hypothetical protein
LWSQGRQVPSGWLDLSIWRGNDAEGIGYFCSVECLEAATPHTVEWYG